MLTESEKKWLEERNYNLEIFGGYYCTSCKGFDKREGVCIFARCMSFCINWEDCAEFEARVAAKLAFAVQDCGDCDYVENCNDDCELVRLKYTRLAVEEEMNA